MLASVSPVNAQGPAIGALGHAHEAHDQRPKNRDADRDLDPRQMKQVHDSSSIVPKGGFTWSDSREASPVRKSVQRRSSESNQRNSLT